MASRKRRNRRKIRKKLICPPELEPLRQRCLASVDDYRAEGKVCNTPDGKYIYRDNGSSILAVAHLDVVQPGPRHFGFYPEQPDIVYNAQLDNRLGACIILDILPTMGIIVDILLTEGEETCRSTATHFWADKPYNWLIEFDRAGTDVVLYDYETPELIALLEAQGEKVGHGTYSDIGVLEHLGVAGFNWGNGSYNNHLPNSYFRISECITALMRFQKFYAIHKDTQFEHIPYTWEEEENWRNPWGSEEYQWEHRRELEWKEAFTEQYYP